MATTTNFGWETPDDTDLVKDGALAMRTLGNAIDTSLVDLKGGTTGQVLSKTSNTDMDFTWVTSDDANAIQNAIVDAKGDLIAASAADTPARLAVGNNGETLVADSSASTGLRYNPQNALANPIINGGFDIWQRGTSITGGGTPTTSFGADRWTCYRSGGAAGSTFSRQTVSDSTNLPNIQYALRAQRNSGNTSTADVAVIQNVETANAIPFAGKTVTWSFYARAGANFSSASSLLGLQFFTGTGTDQNAISGYTGSVTAINTTVTLTTTWQRFVQTFTFPTNATEFCPVFYYTPPSTAAGTNDWFEVTGVQIDLGTYTASSAPTFRRAGGNIAGELAACQRYYYRQTATGDVYQNMGFGMVTLTTTASRIQISNPVTMRVKPTAVDYANVEITDFGAGYAISALTVAESANFSTWLTATQAAGTAYRPVALRAANNNAGYVGLSAEL